MNRSETADAAKAFLQQELDNNSTIPQIAAKVLSGYVSDRDVETLIATKLFESKSVAGSQMIDIKDRSKAGDEAGIREGLSILIETLNEGTRK